MHSSIVVSAMLLAWAEPADEKFKFTAEHIQAVRDATADRIETMPELVKDAKKRLAAARQEQVSPISAKKRLIEKAEADVKELERQAKELKAGGILLPSLFGQGLKLRIGLVGRFDPRTSEVFQVAGPKDVLVKATYHLQDRLQPAKAYEERILRFSGVGTQGLVDRDRLHDDPRFKGLFVIRKTSTYGTAAGGTNTTYVFEPVDAAELIEAVKKATPQ